MIREDKVPGTDFIIKQNTELFCYGIDAVLLANFSLGKSHCIKANSKVVDLGSGNGIIPLILVGKSKLKEIYAVELLEKSFSLIEKNIEENQLTEKILGINCDIKNLFDFIPKNSFEFVTANPPYMEEGTGLKNTSMELSTACHTNLETTELFIKTASLLLKSQGSFCMINRPQNLNKIIFLMEKYKLQVKHLRFVYPSKEKNASMVLIHCVKSGSVQLTVEPPLIIYENKSYTEEVKSFYS